MANPGIIAIDGQVFAFGGNPFARPPWVTAAATRWDPVAGTWSVLPPMSVARQLPRASMITAPSGEKEIYVVGGYSGYVGGPWVERYRVTANTWESVPPLDSDRGAGVVTVAVNNELYVIGGRDNYCRASASNQKYDRPRNLWLSRAPVSKSGSKYGIFDAVPAVWQSRIYLFGGGTASCGDNEDVLIYDPQSDKWTQGTALPRARRGMDCAVVFGDRIYLIGGAHRSPLNEQRLIDVYDPARDWWEAVLDYPFSHMLAQESNTVAIAQDAEAAYVIGTGPTGRECLRGRYVGRPGIHEDH